MFLMSSQANAGLHLHGTSVGPLRFVSANGIGPTFAQLVAVASATTTRHLTRGYFNIGSGDVSKLVLSFYSFYVGASVLAINGYAIESVAIEYNGTSSPVTFSGGRSKIIGSGASDVQADALFPSAFGLSKFAQGSVGYVRMMLTFANPSTDTTPQSAVGVSAQSAFAIGYDPSKVSVTNGVDATGPISYSMINGGINGIDAIFLNTFMMPAMLGTFVSGDPGTYIEIGDSITSGVGDVYTPQGVAGMTRALYPDPTLPTNAKANWNIGVSGGIASAWAAGTPVLLTQYLRYAKFAIEAYGTNALTASASQAIHAQLRAAGVQKILRMSLCPRAQNPCVISISSLTSVGTTATATVASTTNLTTGQTYPISGASPAAYNGSYVITVLSSTTFSYTFAGGTSPATGTIIADDQFRTEAFQVASSGWSPGGVADMFEQAMQALVTSDLTYIETSAVRGSTHWFWLTNGAPFSNTVDGLHPSTAGYELRFGSNSSIVAQSGTTVATMRSVIAAMG